MGIFNTIRKLTGQGCSICGSTSLGNISLREIDSSNSFNGTLRHCAGCSRLFWDSGLILDDQNSYASLEAVMTSGSRYLSIPKRATLLAEPAPPKTEIYRCILGSSFHSQHGIDFVRSVLWHPVLTQNTARLQCIAERISIEIDGYSEDNRELWEIPEICNLFYRMHEEITGIEFWMTHESIGYFLLAAVAGMPNDVRYQAIEISHALRKKRREPGQPVAKATDDELLFLYLALESLESAKRFLSGLFDEQDELINNIVRQSELAKLVG